MTVEHADLDDADKAFITSSFFSSEEAALIGGMGAYTAATKLGSETVTMAVRCISAGAAEPPLRVALFLHGLGEDLITKTFIYKTKREREIYIYIYIEINYTFRKTRA